MTKRSKLDDRKREPPGSTDTPDEDEEEGMRRLMRQLLNTPPQPQKDAKGPSTGRRGRPPKRRGV
jgi:hypothetical protein